MTTTHAEFVHGIKAELPILLGTIPFGLIYGVVARSAGIPALVVQAMSLIVLAGSAQFVAAQLIGAGVPAGIIILTAVIINLRHALYSASVVPYLKRLNSGWKMLLAYRTRKHWYFFGAGLTLWTSWQASTAVGILLGAQVPASWSLDFTLPLTFIALVVPSLKGRASVAAAATAGVVAVLAADLPLRLGLVVAALIGIGIGIGIEPWDRKRASTSEDKAQVVTHTLSTNESPEIIPPGRTGKEAL
ncbi:MAG: AzlC family ABC transporter permease [Chloroflexi bacterium]|nr:MAG: AzlC family ABC transporter permease [Chloroflexota bacterium]